MTVDDDYNIVIYNPNNSSVSKVSAPSSTLWRMRATPM